jgi:hypothetical protein
MEVQTPVMSLGIVCLVKVRENEHKFFPFPEKNL